MNDSNTIDALPSLADVLAMHDVLDQVCASESPLRDDDALGQALAAWSATAKQAISVISCDVTGHVAVQTPQTPYFAHGTADLFIS